MPPNEAKRKLILASMNRACLYQVKRIQSPNGWKWTTNFLREFARGETGEAFSNSQSPDLYRDLIILHPEWNEVITLGKITKKRGIR